MDPGPVKALVVDYDGTLTDHDRLDDDVGRALMDAGARHGLTVVLATGRRWSDLVHHLPEARELFDAVVCENGAVLDGPDGHRPLCDPVSPELADALEAAGVPVERGEVLLACPPGWDEIVFAAVSRLGCDDQVVRNRGQLMVLPPGISKGTGVHRALEEMGISWHNAIGMGDGENDHALLDACEWSAVPATAVPSLLHRADIVLASGPGAALIELLRDHVLNSRPLRSRRRPLVLGADAEGNAVDLRAGNVHLLVTGGTRAGKSFFAGALAEQLIDHDHSVLIVDPEGDYARLRSPRGLFLVAPDNEDDDDVASRVEQLLGHRFGSVVLDLSRLVLDGQRRVVERVVHAIDALRLRSGAPQWLFVDEAHLLLTDPHVMRLALGPSALGTCLVTYRPHELVETALDHADVAIVIPGAAFDDPAALAAVASIGGRTSDDLRTAVASCGTGQAVMIVRANGSCTVLTTLVARHSKHVRHREKYIGGPLPPELHFRFRSRSGDTRGAVAGDVDDFHKALRRCPPETIRHHAGRHDFSAWFGEALQDPWSAADIHDAEDRLRPGAAGIEVVRAAVLGVVEHRYLR